MTRRTPEQYDYDELEFDEQILRKHFTPLGSRDIDYTVAHHMTIKGYGTGSALDACYATWQNREASAHYGIDGQLVRQFVWDKDYAWATGSTAGNLHGISIEHANATLSPKWTIAADTLATGAKLTAYVHKAKKLGRPRSNATGTSGSMRTHSAFFATACPGPYFKTVWDAYVADAQKIYDQITGAKPVEPTPAPKPASNEALWGKPETWKIGATGDDITELGERIVIWSKALRLPDPYKVGPGEPFSETDRAALSRLQVAWGFGSTAADLAKGGHSDGYPGLQTFHNLATDPVPTDPQEPPVTKPDHIFFRILGLNQYADQYTGGRRDISAQQAVFDDAKPSVVLVTEVNRDSDHERWMTICGGWPKVYAIRDSRNNHIYFMQDTWELVDTEQVLLGSITVNGRTQNRGARLAVLRHKASGYRQSFGVTHLSSATNGYNATDALRSRLIESRNLVKAVQTCDLQGWSADDAIIVGDLNEGYTTAGTARGVIGKAYPFLRDQGVKVVAGDTKTFQGWPNPSPLKKGPWLDDIAGRGLVSARVILHTGASDHLGLVATYRRDL